jgi:hypothetical protein
VFNPVINIHVRLCTRVLQTNASCTAWCLNWVGQNRIYIYAVCERICDWIPAKKTYIHCVYMVLASPASIVCGVLTPKKQQTTQRGFRMIHVHHKIKWSTCIIKQASLQCLARTKASLVWLLLGTSRKMTKQMKVWWMVPCLTGGMLNLSGTVCLTF